MINSLKIELHSHTAEDPKDRIEYSSEELIDRMAAAGYEVLSITNHDVVTYDSRLKKYAESKGILLIPGVEITIDKKHVLLINVENYTEGDINCFDDLKRYKKKDTLIIAPHPFYPSVTCVGKKLIEYLSLFDAIEYCHCYLRFLNPNLKAVRLAEEHIIPMIGTSDIHFKHQEFKTYSLVESNKDIKSIINAIKNNKIKVKTSHLRLLEFIKIIGSHTVISLLLSIGFSKINTLAKKWKINTFH